MRLAVEAIEDIVAVVAHSQASGSQFSLVWEVESCGNFSADDLPSSFFLSREGNQEYLVRKWLAFPIHSLLEKNKYPLNVEMACYEKKKF